MSKNPLPVLSTEFLSVLEVFPTARMQFGPYRLHWDASYGPKCLSGWSLYYHGTKRVRLGALTDCLTQIDLPGT